MDGDLGRFYDAIENPRKIRNELPILRGDELRSYMEGVRARTLEVLSTTELEDNDDQLIAGGFIYEMLIAHEHQHNETMLQLLQMVDGYEPVRIDGTVVGEPVDAGPEMVAVECRPARDRRRPTTASRTTTSARGTRSSWRRSRSTAPPSPMRRSPSFSPTTGAEPPMYWERDGDGWVTTTFGRRRPLDPARGRSSTSTGIRPTRSPAGRASGCRPSSSGRRRRRRPTPTARTSTSSASDTAPAGAYAAGAGVSGAVQMLGDVWEWTSSDFAPTRGFAAFPYPEYSEVFFGDTYKVLRGGAWATTTRCDPDELSQLGPPRALTDLLRDPLRKGRLNERMKRNASSDDG